MIVSIHQPNFFPWPGYFHKIWHADIFVFLDDVQYVKGTVANRCYIRRKDGVAVYITVPVKLSKGAFQAYNTIEIDYTQQWVQKMLNMLNDAYLKAPNFPVIFPAIKDILLSGHPVLSALNIALLRYVMDYLGIDTPCILSSEIAVDLGQKSDRNLNICRHLEADSYLSGTGARQYNVEQDFADHSVRLIYTSFSFPDQDKILNEQQEAVVPGIIHYLMTQDVSAIQTLIKGAVEKY